MIGKISINMITLKLYRARYFKFDMEVTTFLENSERKLRDIHQLKIHNYISFQIIEKEDWVLYIFCQQTGK